MLITNATLITWEKPNRILENQAVYIEGGLIAEIGPQEEMSGRYPQAERLDAAAFGTGAEPGRSLLVVVDAATGKAVYAATAVPRWFAALTDRDPAAGAHDPYELVVADGPSTGHALAMLAAPHGVAELAPGRGDHPRVASTSHGQVDPTSARALLCEAEKHGAHVTLLAVGTWLDAHPAMARGILATCTARVAAGATAASVREAWEKAYDDEPFVHLLPPSVWPTTRRTRPIGNSLPMTARVCRRSFSAAFNLSMRAARIALTVSGI